MPVTVGQLFPPDDVVARWVFNLSVLADDLALLDAQIHANLDREPNHGAAYLRMIVTRLYEGRLIVREMKRAKVAEFLLDNPETAEACARLREAYARPKPETKSTVEEAYGRARHLSVHYSKKSGEIARILREAGSVEVRIPPRA